MLHIDGSQGEGHPRSTVPRSTISCGNGIGLPAGDVPPWVDGEALVMTDWNVSTDRDCRFGTENPAVPWGTGVAVRSAGL